jgi:hypothetical protein
VTIIEAVEDQLRRGMEGDAWHGPSVREALEGIDASDAAKHPIPGAHSCWELVLHLAASYQLVLRRLDGNAAPLLVQEDWPAVPEPTMKNWQRDVSALFALNARMREAVLRFPIERLFEPIVSDPPFPAFTQFIGLTQHDLYHAGQIVLLKRAQRNRGSSESIEPHRVGLAHVLESMKDANLRSQATLAAFDAVLEATASSHASELRQRVKQYEDPHVALTDMEREAAELIAQIGELQREAESTREQASLRAQQAWDEWQKRHEEMERLVQVPMQQNEERFAEIEAELSECARLEKDYRDVILQLRSQLTGESDAVVS